MGKGGVGRRGWKFPGENGPCVLTVRVYHMDRMRRVKELDVGRCFPVH